MFEPARVIAVLPPTQFVKLFPPITQLLQPLFKDIWLLPASVLIVLFKNFIFVLFCISIWADWLLDGSTNTLLDP